MLLVRPDPIENESSMGYLLRVAELNGLRSIRRLGAAGFNSPSSELLGPIAGLAGLNRIGRSDLAIRFWNCRRPRICVDCLSENEVCHVVWDTVFFLACPRHQRVLIDRCSNCKESLRWTRPGRLECQCGHDLRAEESIRACDAELKLSCELLEAWNAPSPCFTHLMHELWFIGAFATNQSAKPQKLSGMHDIGRARAVALAGWELLSSPTEQMEPFLTRVRRLHNYPESFKLPERYGAFYRELYAEQNAVWSARLKAAFETHVGYRWDGHLAGRNKRLPMNIGADRAWIPLAVACRTLGMARPAIKREITQGRLEARSYRTCSGRAYVFLRKASVLTFRQNATSWLTQQDLCRRFHVGKATFQRVLREMGLKPVSGPTVDGSSTWRFAPDTIQALHGHFQRLRD